MGEYPQNVLRMITFYDITFWKLVFTKHSLDELS
jgi:hypothetical protein